MANSGDSLAKARQIAAHYAVDHFIKNNSVIGLGTGRTSRQAIERIGEKLKNGEIKNILAIPTSLETENQARSLGIPLTTLSENNAIDVALDGADEVILSSLQLLKGRGGALLREKMVEECAREFVVMVDESKIVDSFGQTGAIPVEVNCFGSKHVSENIQKLDDFFGSDCQLRMKGNEPFLTDNQNYISDVYPSKNILDASKVSQELKKITGVIDHGFFIGMATCCIVAKLDGQIEIHSNPRP